MKTAIVVIRHLLGSRPVASIVIKEPTDPHVDCPEHWMNEKADAHIKEFKEKFPEFKSAEWYKDAVEVTEP